MAQILHNFIVFEGLDGAGTTTQCKKLAEKVNGFFTCEPSDFVTGQFIRKILRKEATVSPETLALLFVADRQEHLFGAEETSVSNQLKSNKIVLCDRYIFSSLAYQGLNVDFDTVLKLNQDFPLPEIVFFLNTATSECQKRINSREAEPELFEKQELQEMIYKNYKKSFDYFKNQTKIYELDGILSIEQLLEQEYNILKENKIV